MADPSSAQSAFSTKDVLVPLLTIAASFAGAWIAAKLALANYYRQQIWQRKADAYTAIFAAIYGVERWHNKHWDASLTGREIGDESKTHLRAEANQAEADLERRLASEIWLLPKPFHIRTVKMIHDLQAASTTNVMWLDFLEQSLSIINTSTSDLQAMAREDLKA
jgi:hypothetical protein